MTTADSVLCSLSPHSPGKHQTSRVIRIAIAIPGLDHNATPQERCVNAERTLKESQRSITEAKKWQKYQ